MNVFFIYFENQKNQDKNTTYKMNDLASNEAFKWLMEQGAFESKFLNPEIWKEIDKEDIKKAQ